MPPASAIRRTSTRSWWLGAALPVALLCAWLASLPKWEPWLQNAVVAAAVVPGAAFAAASSAHASARTGRSDWRFIAVGSLLHAAAAAVSACWLTITQEPARALVGAPYLPGLAILLWGLALLVGLSPDDRRRAHRANVFSVLISALALALTLWLWPVVAAPSLSGFDKAANIASVALEAAIMLLAVILLQSNDRHDQRWRTACWFCSGAALMVAGGLVSIAAPQPAEPWQIGAASVLWPAAYALIGMAALPRTELPDAPPRKVRFGTPVWAFAAMVAPLLAGGLILSADYRDDGLLHMHSVLIAAFLLALYIGRQYISTLAAAKLLRENRDISARLQAFNEQLEAVVQRRTRYLRTLLTVTAATKTSLVEAEVVGTCLSGVLAALEADGCGVWFPDSDEPAFTQGDTKPAKAVWRRARDFLQAPPEDAIPAVNRPFALLGYLQHGQDRLGWLVAWRQKEAFTHEEDTMVEAIAAELGMAVWNARMHARTEEQAERDAVTGLLNRRALEARLAAEISRAHRSGEPLAILMMDLDDFKIFNDTYGHATGDAVLRYIGRALTENTRAFDIVSRYGGDEFIAVLPGADAGTAALICDRVRTHLYNHGFKTPDGEVPLRVSAGAAVLGEDAVTGSGLLAAADIRLYEAKRRRGALTVDPAALRAGLSAIPGFGSLDAMIAAVGHRDRYTRRHSEEVATVAWAIARQLGWTEEEQRSLRMAALLHNVGKVGVAESILRKPGRLSAEEAEAMRLHPIVGENLVASIQADETARAVVRHHHERWDGHGYPDGLAGEAIPLAARIVAVADGFCAMTTHRPYRRALLLEDAISALRAGGGVQWDPALVETLIAALPELQLPPPHAASASE